MRATKRHGSATAVSRRRTGKVHRERGEAAAVRCRVRALAPTLSAELIEGRPTAEEVRVNRTLTPEQSSAKYRWDRDHAHEGPMFGYVRRAHPRADDDAIRKAIITAVRFEDATFAHFSWDGDFWGLRRARGGEGLRAISGFSRDDLSRRPQQRRLLLQVSYGVIRKSAQRFSGKIMLAKNIKRVHRAFRSKDW